MSAPSRNRHLVLLLLAAALVGASAAQWRSGRAPADQELTDAEVHDLVNVLSALDPNGPMIILKGAPRLYLGDSMIRHWPQDGADRIALSGQSSSAILQEALPVLETDEHEEVVLWIGTAHLWEAPTRAAADRLLADTATAVAAAGSHRYVVLGPLCPSFMNGPPRAEFARANAVLAERYGDRYVDPAQVLGLPGGPNEEYRPDGVHLLDEAYWPLARVVEDALGAQQAAQAVSNPAAGDEAA